MNLPRAAVRRPVFTTMATLIIVILGTVSLSRVRIDRRPALFTRQTTTLHESQVSTRITSNGSRRSIPTAGTQRRHYGRPTARAPGP